MTTPFGTGAYRVGRLFATLLALLLAFVLILIPASAYAEDVSTEAEIVTQPGKAVIDSIVETGESGTTTDQLADTEQDDKPTFANDPETATEESPVSATDVATPTSTATDTTLNPVAGSAIQKAVQAALDKASGTDVTEIVILVSAGVYDGDIVISTTKTVSSTTVMTVTDSDGNIVKTNKTVSTATEARSLQDSFKLYIKSTTAGADNLSGNSDVIVNGNITVDGVNVVLAGLYMALDKALSVKDAQVEIYGTTGDDNYTVEVNNTSSAEDDATAVSVHTGAGADAVTIRGGSGTTARATATSSAVNVNTGAGNDVINVDTSIAKANGQVNILGGDGADKVHLTGSLKSGDPVIYASKTDLVTAAATESEVAVIGMGDADGNVVNLFTGGVELYTDALTNKTTASIDASDFDGSHVYTGTPAAFTNYAYTPADSEEIYLIFNGGGLLSSLNISADEISVYSIQASGMNVSLNGKEITVLNNGSISARNLTIAAEDDDHQLDFTVGGSTVGIEDSGFDTNVSASLFDVVSTAKVDIGAGAQIIVAGDVVITAKCTQDQPVLLSANFNVVNVKIGSATIDIDGIIKAGGNVSATANAAVTVVASNEILAKLFIPLAVNVVVTESAVRVSGCIDAGSTEVAGASAWAA